jgi:glycosidase
MTNASIENPSDFRDPLSSQAYEMEIRLMGAPPEQAAVYASQRGRDKTRTPMQWENAPYGGFCPANVKPWLPVNDNYQHGVNVHDQLQDPNSLWWYYQRILKVRRENPALREGEYEAVVFQEDRILAYRVFHRTSLFNLA